MAPITYESVNNANFSRTAEPLTDSGFRNGICFRLSRLLVFQSDYEYLSSLYYVMCEFACGFRRIFSEFLM